MEVGEIKHCIMRSIVSTGIILLVEEKRRGECWLSIQVSPHYLKLECSSWHQGIQIKTPNEIPHTSQNG